MKYKTILYLLLSMLIFACGSNKALNNYSSETLKVEKLSKNTYLHISYLQTESFGNVACNGMVVVHNNEAFVVDTPTSNAVSNELIAFIQDSLHAKVVGVLATHFHVDCLGGLNAFHHEKIQSYALNKTIELAKKEGFEVPKLGFKNSLYKKIGNLNIESHFFGKGHAQDNVVVYVNKDKVLFGGCLVKSMNASKGYLGDASVSDWPSTIINVGEKFPETKIVIPGHGKVGGKELLKYTKALFEVE